MGASITTPQFAAEVRAFWHAADEVLAPALWEAELANVLWMAVRSGVLPGEEAAGKLGLAGRLGIHSVPTRRLWHGALLRAVQAAIPVYDTLFVELAEREGLPLITFDSKMARAYPQLCKRPGAVR
jgi:predicted nucleic acid-binding protein